MMNQQYIYILVSSACRTLHSQVFYNTLNHIILYHCWTNSIILPVLIFLVTTIREFTLLLYSTTLLIIILIIFDICNDEQYYIYSRILPVLISACCNKFSHYNTWIYSITVFYNTLKHNHIILYHIWYLLHDEPNVLYIFQNTPSIVSACCIEFNHYKMSEFTLLQYSTTLSSIIASFCIIFDICYMMNQQCYIYSRVLQVLFQHAALNLITTKWEFTLLQYSTTLSSIIASFCIIFDICYMMNQKYYIYSRILPVLISTCCIEFNH